MSNVKEGVENQPVLEKFRDYSDDKKGGYVCSACNGEWDIYAILNYGHDGIEIGGHTLCGECYDSYCTAMDELDELSKLLEDEGDGT